MVTQKQIDRINELARKSKTPEGLTEAEKAEQQELRQAYIEAYRESLKGQLHNTVVLQPDGTKVRLDELKKKKK